MNGYARVELNQSQSIVQCREGRIRGGYLRRNINAAIITEVKSIPVRREGQRVHVRMNEPEVLCGLESCPGSASIHGTHQRGRIGAAGKDHVWVCWLHRDDVVIATIGRAIVRCRWK